jgi:metallo-beta-lactamase class B
MFKRFSMFCVLCAAALFTCSEGWCATNPDWTTPFPPHRIAGNLYYVGSKDLASFLIVTPQGNILINSNLASSPALIRRSVEQLGFRFADIKILLISHAHMDHCAGSARIKQLTHAKYMVMDADVATVESGGRKDFAFGNTPSMYYPPAQVDRVLHDGDQVSLGGTVLMAHLTAGHTKGCTTWTLQVPDHGKLYNVVIVGSPSILSEYKLIGNKAYPGIATDFTRQFQTLRSLPCDIFLSSHGSAYGLIEKYARLKEGQPNPFVDPAGYQAFVTEHQRDFEEALRKQQRSAMP